jgi:hypothetical protein
MVNLVAATPDDQNSRLGATIPKIAAGVRPIALFFCLIGHPRLPSERNLDFFRRDN